jgi:Zn-dependent protease with chaperone function/uncharacterized tellurite resistance protein B-like protein
MNFFAQQDRARKNTFWLVILLIIAVACLIIMTVLVVALMLYFFQQPHLSTTAVQKSLAQHIGHVFRSDFIFYAAGGVLTVVATASFYKLVELGGHGSKIAEALGGKKIQPNSLDADERKALNVVEEMAIASGNPVPPVYLIEDNCINAFAAGTDRRNAVIGITCGSIHLLSRDELQGVIAHEFSHIHFGDIRINMRLIALLHGILIIGLIGSFLLRSSNVRGRSKGRGIEIGIGLAFLILGYGGSFFGNIIKAAVSRQREFLADASAVQFTRNPEGIANALKKMGGLSIHALLNNPKASEFSHFYFGQGVETAFNSWMATHPPLEDRIRKVQPNWDGNYIKPDTTASVRTTYSAQPNDNISSASAFGQAIPLTTLTNAVDLVGNPTPENIHTARTILEALPNSLRNAAAEPFLARLLIYGLLLDQDSKGNRTAQVDRLTEKLDSSERASFDELHREVLNLGRAQHLPLIELTIPALKSQSASQYQEFKKIMIDLIKADQQVSIFEWSLYRIVTETVEEKQRPNGKLSLAQTQDAIETLLAAACLNGKTLNYRDAYTAAKRYLPNLELKREPNSNLSFQELDKALSQLIQLKPLHKPLLLKALAACIQADKIVTADEAELFRAIADCLDCPVPLIQVSVEER